MEGGGIDGRGRDGRGKRRRGREERERGRLDLEIVRYQEHKGC